MVALPRTDPYYEDKDNYVHLSPLWLANLVDIFNEAMTLIEQNIMSIDARLTAGGL